MKLADLKFYRFVPKVIIMPKWLRKLPPFSKFVYCERTYSNSYVSNTWTIVCLLKRDPVAVSRSLTKPVVAIMSDEDCRAIVYAGSAMQTTCLVIKTMFCPVLWTDVIRNTAHKFRMQK